MFGRKTSRVCRRLRLEHDIVEELSRRPLHGPERTQPEGFKPEKGRTSTATASWSDHDEGSDED